MLASMISTILSMDLKLKSRHIGNPIKLLDSSREIELPPITSMSEKAAMLEIGVAHQDLFPMPFMFKLSIKDLVLSSKWNIQ